MLEEISTFLTSKQTRKPKKTSKSPENEKSQEIINQLREDLIISSKLNAKLEAENENLKQKVQIRSSCLMNVDNHMTALKGEIDRLKQLTGAPTPKSISTMEERDSDVCFTGRDVNRKFGF